MKKHEQQISWPHKMSALFGRNNLTKQNRYREYEIGNMKKSLISLCIVAYVTVSTIQPSIAADNLPSGGQPLTITEGTEWTRPIRLTNVHQRNSGSIIDLTGKMARPKIDEDHRVVIKDGHFVYAKHPDKPLRFFCSADTMRLSPPQYLQNRRALDQYARDLVSHGYNMIRIHINDALMYCSGTPAVFNTLTLDNFDYLVKLCRENGIYIMMNVMESRYGFEPSAFDQWGATKEFDNRTHMDFRYALYFSEAARRNWADGAKNFFDRLNPYTGIKLKDDPAVLLLEGYNEQEFAFNYRDITPENQALTVIPWRNFLRNRHKTIDAYNAQWKTDFKSFDEIPCFTIKEKNADVNDFIYDTSRDLLNFYKDTLKQIGITAYVTNYDFVPTLIYNFIRRDCDYVAIHSYQDHPLGTFQRGKKYNKQTSGIANNGYFVRNLTQARIFRKPMLCTEYDQPFWNKYRYERSFTMGAYAAFQDIDAITVWNAPSQRIDFTDTSLWRGGTMMPFKTSADPLSDASQLLSWCMYIRGDVATAKHAVRIITDRKSVFERNPNAVESPELTSLAMLTKYSQQSVDDLKEVAAAEKNELLFPSLGGGKIRIEGFFIEDAQMSGNSASYVKVLRDKGFLPSENRSDGKTVFESETGELYLDTARKYMTVNTERLQGMCGLAGATAKLADFEVIAHDKDGNLTVTAMDGMKPIRNANRLLLVRLTNALNTNMTFTNQDMCRLEDAGTIPGLLRNSKFTIKIRNDNAGELKLYPLSLEGVRTGKVIAPVSVEDGCAIFSVDTAKDGNTVYFEGAR